MIKDTYSVVYKRKLTQPLITQTINLTGTYNWVSFYLDTLEGENGLKLLQQSLGNNATKISTSTNADGEHNLISTYNQSTGTWDGNLTSINLKSSYQITCTNPTTIEFDGYAVDYENYKITLKTRWNFIGYPVNKTVFYLDAIKNIVPTSFE